MCYKLSMYNVLYLCISRLLEEAWMFLEHLASYNGADMHKYNTLYTRKLSWHVLPPTSLNPVIVYLK